MQNQTYVHSKIDILIKSPFVYFCNYWYKMKQSFHITPEKLGIDFWNPFPAVGRHTRPPFAGVMHGFSECYAVPSDGS